MSLKKMAHYNPNNLDSKRSTIGLTGRLDLPNRLKNLILNKEKSASTSTLAEGSLVASKDGTLPKKEIPVSQFKPLISFDDDDLIEVYTPTATTTNCSSKNSIESRPLQHRRTQSVPLISPENDPLASSLRDINIHLPVNLQNTDQIRQYLAARFAQFPAFSSDTDWYAIKLIIILVAHSTALLWNIDDDHLHSQVIDWALERIPKKFFVNLPAHRINSSGKPKSTADLLQYLGHQLAAHNAAIYLQYKKKMANIQRNNSRENTRIYFNMQTCYYCKEFGHRTEQCPDIANIVCFKCYQFGHTNRRCRNAPLFKEPIL